MPVGTGPFIFKEYRIGSLVRFYRNEMFWRNPPQAKQLVFDITPNNTGRLTKLLTGECDIITNPIAHHKIKENENLTLHSITSMDVSFLAFNTIKPPFNNVNVRKAIAYAIDKKAIIKNVYNEQAVIANSILPPGSWTAPKKINAQEYSPNKAQEILSQQELAEPITMNLWVPSYYESYNPDILATAISIQENLALINIKVNIIDDHDNEFFEGSTKVDYDAVLTGWLADHPDPDNFFTTLLSCEATEIETNKANWCHQEFDSLIKNAIQTEKTALRKLTYDKALTIINNQYPVIPLAHSQKYEARSAYIKGRSLFHFGLNFLRASKS